MLAFSNDYYGIIFRATQSVELFCAYKMCVMDGGTLHGNYNYIAYDNSCIGCEILNITVQMYPCSEGTDTGSLAL